MLHEAFFDVANATRAGFVNVEVVGMAKVEIHLAEALGGDGDLDGGGVKGAFRHCEYFR
jgi:hypothetical protein